jgi:ribonuclease P protein subunit POP4
MIYIITKDNLLFSTFIGLDVEIVNSSQRELIGRKGIIVDETKNLIVIEEADGKEFKVPKVTSTFRFTLDNGEKIDVVGREIAFRPHERPKKV